MIGHAESCRSCGKLIFWAHSAKRDKSMPVDYRPSNDGNLHVYIDDKARTAVGVLTRGQAEGMRAAGQPTYQAHFRTCPDAADWRKRPPQGRGGRR